MRQMRLQKQKKRKGQEQNNEDLQIVIKQHCLNIDLNHLYLFSSKGMISFTADYIQHLKETYTIANIVMQYFGYPNATKVTAEKIKKYCTQIVAEMEKSKYHSLMSLHNSFPN
jgi:hypothetical protein